MFGIDKIVLKGLKVMCYDESLFSEEVEYFTRDNKGRVKAKVVDKRSNSCLTIDYKVDEVGVWVEWSHLHLNPQFFNLRPRSLNEVVSQLHKAINNLKDNGIEVSCDELKVKSIEVNNTFKLNSEWEDYLQVLRFIKLSAPKPIRRMSCGSSEDMTLYLKYKSFELKIYNKSKELIAKGVDLKMLEERKILDDVWCRVEYTFTDEKLMREFGTIKLDEIKEVNLKSLFVKQFMRDVVKPTDQRLDQQLKEAYKLLLQEKIKDSYNCVDRAMHSLTEKDVDVLLDIETLFKAIRQVDKLNGSRTVKRLKKVYDHKWHTGNLMRLQEIISKCLTVKSDC